METGNTVVLLAGGKSKRMGYNKEYNQMGGQVIVHQLIGQLKKLFDEIIVVTNCPELYQGQGVILVRDIIFQKGPLSGIHVGLVTSSSPYAFVLACDMPYLSPAYIALMRFRLAENFEAVVSMDESQELQPFHGFYSRALIKPIEAYLASGRRSLNQFLKERAVLALEPSAYQPLEGGKDIFVNINTVEELRQIESGEQRG